MKLSAEILLLLRQIKSALRDQQITKPLWVNQDGLIERFGLTADQIRSLRLDPTSGWIEGIHFARPSQRSVIYNVELIHDWLVNQNDPSAHSRAIDAYLKRLAQRMNLPVEAYYWTLLCVATSQVASQTRLELDRGTDYKAPAILWDRLRYAGATAEGSFHPWVRYQTLISATISLTPRSLNFCRPLPLLIPT